MKKRSAGFDWRRRQFDHDRFIRTVSALIAMAIVLVIAVFSINRPKVDAPRWCDARTSDCYDRLLLRGSVEPRKQKPCSTRSSTLCSKPLEITRSTTASFSRPDIGPTSAADAVVMLKQQVSVLETDLRAFRAHDDTFVQLYDAIDEAVKRLRLGDDGEKSCAAELSRCMLAAKKVVDPIPF